MMRTKNLLLWTVQTVLALLFLFAGGMKLVLPLEAMQQGPIVLPGLFLRFIGVCEVLGGLGLVLPGLFRIHQELTPVAAAGLVVIMTGATVLTAQSGPIGPALFPLFIGVLCAVVAYSRTPAVTARGALALAAR